MREAPKRHWFKFSLRTFFVSLVVLWVCCAVMGVNLSGTMIFGQSHGLRDYATVVAGWPVVYCMGTETSDQAGLLPGKVTKKSNQWFSVGALLIDIAVALLMMASTAAISAKVYRLCQRRKFFLTDLLWAVFAVALFLGITFEWERTPDLVRLLGADLDRPRLALMLWYPWWIRAAMAIGTVSSTLLFLSALTLMSTALYRRFGSRTKHSHGRGKGDILAQ